ncbi:hypothetical protein CPC735_030660 [Coccidioides posadasii C735 delta SOWgp]|uniref:Uncharacterized protein n=1 Tax=Coccidioides posadasii (strain C735) TaxID=222929 RepID=C5P4U0_COCP7|nr:hypothetical protein CPC735_030660 [Coccidioides posadasii C735 delta SOWgp]EER27730.1 hypothetical protein CPC735_030660 [Coccidioides posadasii C735 delta SOWgp]|eukprot:XP_003069875.1 hypothetical protein CPC735_030660 [Coccidioides posadasii C735 delta SOWgp]
MAQGAMWRAPALFSRCAAQTSKFSRSSRSFSSTPSYSKEILPPFKPSSSPELTELLEVFRQKLFIPMSLSLRHKRLMFKQKYAQKLQDNPISVKVGGQTEESYLLKPMKPEDQPGSAEFRKMVSLMKTREDWLNIIPFLTGLQNSKRPFATKNLVWLVRKAGLAGQASVMVESVKQSKRTGLTLANVAVAKNLFLAIRYKAQEANFKGGEAETALRQARQMADLFDAPEHTAADRMNDAKHSPEIIAILLELSAANTLDSLGGKDVEGQVRAYATRLLSTWSFGNFDVPALWETANFRLLELIPVWNGMNLALQVDEIKADADLSNALRSRMGELGKTIEASVEKVTKESDSADRSGVVLAKRLYHK